MGWFSNIPRLTSSYDSYDSEVKSITTPSTNPGIAVEVTKTIFPFLQLSTVKNSKNHQFFSTLSFSNSIFQFCTDSSRSYQFKSSVFIGPVVSKFQSIVTSKKQVYSQLESMYSSALYNIGFKLIKPTFDASNLVYVVNYWRSFGMLCMGFEVVGLERQLGVSLSTRVQSSDSVFCLNLQRFNTLTVSVYKRIAKFLELGIEVKKDKENFKSSVGVRIQNFKSDIKASMDQALSMAFSWDEKLSESLRVNFNCGYDWEVFDYGIGLSYES